MVDPTTVEWEAFTVVGRHYRGRNEDGEIGVLWQSLEELESALAAISESDARFGVSYGGDPDTGEFEYVAGVRVDPDADVPEGTTAVDVPAATYLRVETTLETIDETMGAINQEWLPGSGYDLAMGPDVERYPPGFDRSDPHATLEVYLPVVAAE